MNIQADLRDSPPLAIAISTARSSSGAVRRVNEDGYLDRPELGLWAVADGMGGHRCGEIASSRIVESLAALGDGGSASALLAGAFAALEGVHKSLLAERRSLGGAGATVVVLVASEGRYACLWAGDSRAYHLTCGRLHQVTHDHSVIQELIDSGVLTAQQARRDTRAHLVTRAVGAEGDLRLELASGAFGPGDLFLLCTDGLTGCVDDGELAHGLDPCAIETSADRLLALALARGAPDNVTLVVASFS